MKAKEIREMSSEELENKLKELKNELFNLRFQHAINQLDNPHKIEDVKKDIARLLTEQRARQIAAENSADAQ